MLRIPEPYKNGMEDEKRKKDYRGSSVRTLTSEKREPHLQSS